MYYAIKGNKQMQVGEQQISEYAQLGYDIYHVPDAPCPEEPEDDA